MAEATQQTSSDNAAVRTFQAGFPEAELTDVSVPAAVSVFPGENY